MSWEGSTRRDRLPANWKTEVRPSILERDKHRCQLQHEDICIGTASEVDHIVAGDDHAPANLQAICTPCHRFKSSSEGAAARPRINRPPEPHPALG